MAGIQEYQGQHTPDAGGAQLHDLTGGEVYPADVYGQNGGRYYCGGAEELEVLTLACKLRGQPDALVEIFRAVPAGAGADINAGDWVSPSRAYAEVHGELRADAWDGSYAILSRVVRASELRTSGDSLAEWGFFPEL